MKSILNLDKTYKQQPLMFGESLGIYDSIHVNPAVKDVMDRALAQIWSASEFSFAPCKAEFLEQNDGRDMMVETLMWQWSADSAACNLYTLLQPFLSDDSMSQLMLFNTYMECVHPDHEVFTPEGWKGIADINVGDLVLQWDPKDYSLSFTEVTNTIQKKATEDLILFERSTFQQLVTPKHRMVMDEFQRKGISFIFAKDYKRSDYKKFLASGLIQGERDELSAKEKFWIIAQTTKHLKNYTEPEEDVLDEAIFDFRFTSVVERTEFFDVVRELGWEFQQELHKGEMYRNFIVHIPKDEYIGMDSISTFGWIDYTTISHKWCREFISEVEYWNKISSKSLDRSTYYNNPNEKARRVYETVAHLCGKLAKHSSNKTYPNITVTSEGFLTNAVSVKTKRVPYKGDVYCITVPTGAFLTRYRNVISVTGNCVHSETYSEIVKNAFSDPEEVLESLSKRTNVIERLSKVNEVFYNLRQAGLDYSTGKRELDYELVKDVYKGVVALYLMERIQFIASFAITFALGEMGRFQPICQAIRKICADEVIIHAESDMLLIRELQKHPFFQGIEITELNREVYELAEEVIKRELSWTDTLFEGRSLPGITADSIKEWVLFNYQIVKKNLGLPVDNKYKSNPIPFINSWISSNAYQSAPQEQEIGQYLVGAITDDIDGATFDLDF